MKTIILKIDVDDYIVDSLKNSFAKEVSQHIIHNFSTKIKPSGKGFILNEIYPLHIEPDTKFSVFDIEWNPKIKEID